MNKLKSLLTWGLLLAATHAMGYTITVDPIEINAGQSTNLIINLSNTETNLTAYQMKVFLPDGVTVQKKSNGKYAYTANADRTDPDLFTFSVKDAADGSVLIAVFSPDKDVIAGTSGELIRLPLDVASTVTTSLQGSIKNIEFTDVQSQAHTISNVNFTLTMEGGDTPPIVTGDVVVSVPDVSITAGSSANLIINLTNTQTDLTAYQMKVFLPNGITVQKKSNGKYAYTANADRTDPDLFTFSVKDAADGSVLIAVFSPDKDVIAGTSGELIRLPLDVASTVTTSLQGSIQNIEFTNVNAQAYNLDDVTISFILSNAGQPSPNIVFADANVKALCLAANWDTNGDGELSEAEAAAVTTLGDVFKGNTDITSFDEFQYFTGVTSLSDWGTFSGCSSLQSIVIPAGVTTIYGGSFPNCSALRHISVDANNSVYDSRNDCNAIIETTSNRLVVGCETTQIPNTVTTIGSVSFWGRWAMSTMTIPASVTTIEYAAFAFCNLSSITIPANVTYIVSEAFRDCNNLVSVTVGNQSPVAIDENTFTNRANATLYVPAGSKTAYEEAPYWQEFGTIVEMVDIVDMVDIVINGDFEGNDVSCFYARDVLSGNNGSDPLYDPLPATIATGEGKDGSNCIKIQSADNPLNTWDTQLFIRLPQTLPAGTKYYVSFDYKANHDAWCTTQVHTEPGEYIHWEGIGNVNYTTDWQHFEYFGVITGQQSPADNPMRTIAFNLAETSTATTYYFDNIVFKLYEEHYAPEVSKLTQTLELASLPEMTEGDAAFALPQQTDQGLALVWSVADATIASISGNQLTPLTAGTTTVTATQAGNDTYLPFTKDFTLTVNERSDEPAINNTISCTDITARRGQQVELPIVMTNDEDHVFVGFGFTLTLPEGVTIALNAKGKPIFTLSSRIDAEEFITNQYQKLSDNSWAFPFLASTENGVIDGTEGEIMTITLEIADDLDDGNYDISLTDVYTNVKSDDFFVETVNLSSSVSTLTINNVEMGDVNTDGKVDTSDAIMVIYYSLSLNPAHFLNSVADMNGDGKIDTSDAIMIIYKSLGLLQN